MNGIFIVNAPAPFLGPKGQPRRAKRLKIWLLASTKRHNVYIPSSDTAWNLL